VTQPPGFSVSSSRASVVFYLITSAERLVDVGYLGQLRTKDKGQVPSNSLRYSERFRKGFPPGNESK
jgi:hypothetical protein